MTLRAAPAATDLLDGMCDAVHETATKRLEFRDQSSRRRKAFTR